MKLRKFILIALLFCSTMVYAKPFTNTTMLNYSAPSIGNNRLMVGFALEGTSWLEQQPEPLWRLGVDLLIPCTERLSIGAFGGLNAFNFDGGLLSSWRFEDNSRAMIGLGYSATYDTPFIRLAYKTRGRWYFLGWIGGSISDNDYIVGLGIGYAIFGGR